MGSDESRFNVSLIVRDNVTRLSTNNNLSEKKAEPKRNRTEALLLTSLAPYHLVKLFQQASKRSFQAQGKETRERTSQQLGIKPSVNREGHLQDERRFAKGRVRIGFTVPDTRHVMLEDDWEEGGGGWTRIEKKQKLNWYIRIPANRQNRRRSTVTF